MIKRIISCTEKENSPSKLMDYNFYSVTNIKKKVIMIDEETWQYYFEKKV